MADFARMDDDQKAAHRAAERLRRKLKPLLRTRKRQVRDAMREGMDSIALERECFRGALHWTIGRMEHELSLLSCRGRDAQPDTWDDAVPF